MEISEAWTSRPARLGVADFFAFTGDSPFALLYGDGPLGRWLVFGEDPLVRVASPDLSPFAFERRGEAPPILPDFIGFASYEWGTSLEALVPARPPAVRLFPGFRFAIYRRILAYDRARGILYEGRRERASRDTASRETVSRDTVSRDTVPRDTVPRDTVPRVVEEADIAPLEGLPHLLGSGPFRARKTGDSDSAESYAEKVRAIREEIASGEVYQVNLSRRESWEFSGDLRAFALALYKANPAPFSALIAEPDCAIVSSSPERLLHIGEGRMEARPIKGTAPRGATSELDRELRDGLLASSKDRAELAMIVDLLRNDLSRVCLMPSVRVEAFPLLESYANVHHLVASVVGRVPPSLEFASLLRASFPGGSVTGCPKIAAMRAIRALEIAPRDVYTGALGWFSRDLSQADFSIPIRSAWTTGAELRFGVGGAVVWDSDPRAEYEETVHKGRSLVACLSSPSTR